MKFEDDELIRNGFETKYFHFFEFMTNSRKCTQIMRFLWCLKSVPVYNSMPKAHFTSRINNVKMKMVYFMVFFVWNKKYFYNLRRFQIRNYYNTMVWQRLSLTYLKKIWNYTLRPYDLLPSRSSLVIEFQNGFLYLFETRYTLRCKKTSLNWRAGHDILKPIHFYQTYQLLTW